MSVPFTEKKPIFTGELTMKLTKQLLRRLIRETVREGRMNLVESKQMNFSQIMDILRGNTDVKTVGIMSGQNPMAQQSDHGSTFK